MTIKLPAELEKQIQAKVDSGRYPDPATVIEEGLRLIEQRDRTREECLEELRREIAIGLEQADKGELLDGESVFDQIEERIRAISGEE